MEILLDFIIRLAEIGFGIYLVHKIFSGSMREVALTIGRDWLKLSGKFFKK